VMGLTRRSYHSTYLRPRDTSATEETETEPSERQRRPRGRPRREPSTDHERGSSRSSRDDDVPLPMVGEAAARQMYDDTIPHASEEAVPHTFEEGVGGSTSSAASKPYLRGPAKLSKRPIPVDRHPLIAPNGDK
jgi:hypothetical protein